MNIDLSHYKGLIFDMDGTLVDTMPTHLEAWRLTAEHHEFEFSYEWFYELGGVPTLETIVMVNEAQDLRLEPLGVSITKQQIFESICSKIDLIDETHGLLLQHRPDKKIAIGTGADKLGADRTLAASGLIGNLVHIKRDRQLMSAINCEIYRVLTELLELQPLQVQNHISRN